MKSYIKKIFCYLPEIIVENTNERLRKKTGIERRHICAENETAADMAVKAAEKLFSTVPRDSIDYILFCTQSPDYYLPTTACILQDRLGLKKSCGALDFNHGCTGYIYGLGLSKGLIESGQAENILLLTAETYSKYINSEDQAVNSLFGDAATATLITAENTEKNGIAGVEYGTDGAGFKNLIVPVGGMRQRYQNTKIFVTTDKHGNSRTNQNLFMDGAAITDFALEVVPQTLENILQKNFLRREEMNYYVFHQANNFMLKSLQKICRLEDLNFWNDVKSYGNTVSNSIPIALADILQENKPSHLQKVLLLGFGVGLSWGGCVVDLSLCDC